jgi:hypothetical protein
LHAQTLEWIGTCTRRFAASSRIAFAALVIVASGCGYHFAAEGSGLPPQAKTLYVEKFGNRTRETGINDQFMRFLEDEVANHKRLQLVDSPSDADLVLSGDIVFVDALPVSFNSANEPLTYTQTITADASLVDAHDHKVIWATRGVSSSQQMPVVGESVVTTSPYFVQQNLRSQDIANMQDIQVAQTQQASTQELIMQSLAQNLYASMSEGF